MVQLKSTPVVPSSETADFLEALLRPATPDSYLEIRPMRGGETVDRSWHRVGDLRKRGFQTSLPVHLDGKANVYYGVCPRAVQGGTAEDVSQATAIWFDEITRSAPDLPPFSWIIETSPGKVQGGYFLKQSSRNLDRVCRLVRRLAAYVGGDNVYDRARILRLPGFINAKYLEAPRSYLLEFHPDLRYTLEDLERVIPVIDGEEGQGHPRSHHVGPFNPHEGQPLSPEGQDELMDFIHGWDLRRQYDGRYAGACPLPHVKGPCECESAFYISPVTGRWWCFCSDHIFQGTQEGAL